MNQLPGPMELPAPLPAPMQLPGVIHSLLVYFFYTPHILPNITAINSSSPVLSAVVPFCLANVTIQKIIFFEDSKVLVQSSGRQSEIQSWDELQQKIESCRPPIQLLQIEKFNPNSNFVDFFCPINISYFTEASIKLRQVDFTTHPQAFHEFFGGDLMPQSIVFEDIEGVPDLPAAINQLPALSHASSLEILVGNGVHDNIHISQEEIMKFLQNNHPSNGIKSMTVDVEYLQDSLESIITKFYQIFEETSMERTHLLIFKTDSLIQNKAYAAVPTDVSEAITERLLQNINLSCLFISMDISSPLRANNWIISSLASITSNNISLVTRPIQQLSFFFRLAKKNSTEDFDFSLWKSSYWRHYVLYSIKRCRNLTFAAVRMSLVRVNLTQHEKLFKAVGQLWNSILENLAEALSPNAKFVVKLRLMLKGYNSGESARFLAFSDQLQGALSKKGYQMIDRTIKTQTHTNSTRPDITMIYVEENTPSFQFYIHAYCENCYQE